jgi:nitric oxide reductase subunit B
VGISVTDVASGVSITSEPVASPATVVTDDARQFATLTFLRGGLVALGVTLIAGILGALYYVPAIAPVFQSLGIDLRQLRPIHATFAIAWIFVAGAAVVYRYLEDVGEPATKGDRIRLRIQVLCWAAAGVGVIGTLALGITSGREYVGFHPIISALIVIGWCCYLWNFYRVVGKSFWSQPVYVTMWGVALFFFLFTFLEQHAYLLPQVFADPVQDLRVQWKATGTLVGSFNLFVYGTIVYIGEKMTGDKSYGHSRMAYALLAVGLLNSFTNFGHHSYHLPQSAVVNWISFVVSMTEIAILARCINDVWRLMRDGSGEPNATKTAFNSAKWWTFAILFSSILISIPTLNSVIHGTYVVTGHAMGATIGIDSMVLLAAVFWLLKEFVLAREGVDPPFFESGSMRRRMIGLNVAVAALVIWLHVSGLVTGLTRMTFAPGETYIPPAWLGASNGIVFAATGLLVLVFFESVLRVLARVGFGKFQIPVERS